MDIYYGEGDPSMSDLVMFVVLFGAPVALGLTAIYGMIED
jgi:hypothetical protein